MAEMHLPKKGISMSTTMSANRFANKVAFVTGAGKGIGRATAIAFAQEGARLALADFDAEANSQTAKLIRNEGGEAITVHVDVTSENDVRSAIEETMSEFGRLDVAFNNVGRIQKPISITESTVDEWRLIMDTNALGVFLGMKYQIPALLQSGGGAIVNTASGAGLRGRRGLAIYTAAKHAVAGLTRAASLEYARQGIRINAVAPGPVDTELAHVVTGGSQDGIAAMEATQPIGRLGKPEEIASAVLWLASPQAGYTLGTVIPVDGGRTAE
jgi:NAD(P)-dependent dehydrogenase (short-subunit alcohol dehydrogenase family)